MGHFRFHEKIIAHASSGLRVKFQTKSLRNHALSAIGTKQIRRKHRVLRSGDLVLQEAHDLAVSALLEPQQLRIEARLEPTVGGKLDQHGLDVGLRQIDVEIRTGGLVLAAAGRIMAPRVEAAVLLAGHAVAPAVVLDAAAAVAQPLAVRDQAQVAEGVQRALVRDVGARLFRRAARRADRQPC